jgi:hypothetical protein
MKFPLLIRFFLNHACTIFLIIHNNFFESIKPANYLKSSLDFERKFHNEKIGVKVDSTYHTISNSHNVYHILQGNTKIYKQKHANMTNLLWTHVNVF